MPNRGFFLCKGTIFRAVCPNLFLEEKSIPKSPPASLTKKPRALHILIAEDNPVNQKLMSRLIEGQGHTVVIADTGKTVLEALTREPLTWR